LILFIFLEQQKKRVVAKFTLAVKNVSVDEEDQIELLPDVDNNDVQIPDTAHQISTGLVQYNFHQ